MPSAPLIQGTSVLPCNTRYCEFTQRHTHTYTDTHRQTDRQTITLLAFWLFIDDYLQRLLTVITAIHSFTILLCIIIIIINKVLIKVTLKKVIAGALYIVICG